MPITMHIDSRPRTVQLLMLLLVASMLRLIFYTGFFGSDEVTYTQAAFKLLEGDWSVSSYVGSNRYGINLPVAASAALFGKSEFSAALYSMVCSLAEIWLLAWMGARLVGSSLALAGAWLLALTPLHVHLAGRLLADAPMALCVTASFLLFFIGEIENRAKSFFLAGVAAGCAFWIKPAAIFYVAVFVAVPLLMRRWNRAHVWMIFGLFVMILANCALFALLTGEWLYIFRVSSERMASGYLASELASGKQIDSPGYYIDYLFAKPFHTAWLGPLGVLGAYFALRSRQPAALYICFWALGLILVLSLMPVSLRPLTFVPKQTNYMTLFLAPIALLAALGLQKLGRMQRPAWCVIVGLAFILGALEQNQIANFTANSHALVELAKNNPRQQYWVGSNAGRAAQFEGLVRSAVPNVSFYSENVPTLEGFVVVDPQTSSWGGDLRLEDVRGRDCWISVDDIRGSAQGAGPFILGGVANYLPDSLGSRLKALFVVSPAQIFQAKNC